MMIMAMMATQPNAVGFMVISAVSLNPNNRRKTDVAIALRGPMDNSFVRGLGPTRINPTPRQEKTPRTEVGGGSISA
jgi:hypothetical protein